MMKNLNDPLVNYRLFFKVFLLMVLVYTLFVTKPWTNVSGFIYGGDDHSYFAYTNSLVNDLDLDFSNNDYNDYKEISSEFTKTNRIINPHPIGTGLLLIPFYALAKPVVILLNSVLKQPFNQKDPVFFIFMCSGIVLYMFLGCFFLYKSLLRLGFSLAVSLSSSLMIVWGTILPIYAFKRPIFTHVPEFFLISLLLLLLIKFRKQGVIKLHQVVILGILNGLIMVTRFNNVHILFFSLCFLFFSNPRFLKQKSVVFNKIAVISIALISALLLIILTQGLAWIYFYGGFFHIPFKILIPANAIMVKSSLIYEILTGLKSLVHTFFGVDWGLIFTMLPFVIGIVSAIIFVPLNIYSGKNGKMIERLVYLLVFMVPFFIVVKWQKQGCFYGYRYLLSILPFCCLGFAAFLDRLIKKYKEKISNKLVIGSIMLVAINFLLILPFEYTTETTLTPQISTMGGFGWVNNQYVVNAVKFYFVSGPKKIAGAFARGFLGAYAFGAISIVRPDKLDKFQEAKVIEYYKIDSINKVSVLFYPLIVFGFLFSADFIIRKRVYGRSR